MQLSLANSFLVCRRVPCLHLGRRSRLADVAVRRRAERASDEDLPAVLHLQWTRAYAPRVQVWDDPLNNDIMSYDRVFEPIVLGETMLLGFNDADKLVALNVRTGRELWTFYTDGPVRLPPAGWKGMVYAASDDGYLYCLDVATGKLKWKFRGGPSAHKTLGNARMISMWPARGGPVVRNGRVYFAAGIWPFLGVFVYALDAQTGKVEWTNDRSGAVYALQPHGRRPSGPWPRRGPWWPPATCSWRPAGARCPPPSTARPACSCTTRTRE